MMAEATGKLTGVPGVAFVTRAPGATNAASGIYVAHHDATPMVLLVGLVERAAGRGAFQEIDLEAMFGAIANWVGVVREAERIPEYRGTRLQGGAFRAPRTGRARAAGGCTVRRAPRRADAAPAQPRRRRRRRPAR